MNMNMTLVVYSDGTIVVMDIRKRVYRNVRTLALTDKAKRIN